MTKHIADIDKTYGINVLDDWFTFLPMDSCIADSICSVILWMSWRGMSDIRNDFFNWTCVEVELPSLETSNAFPSDTIFLLANLKFWYSFMSLYPCGFLWLLNILHLDILTSSTPFLLHLPINIDHWFSLWNLREVPLGIWTVNWFVSNKRCCFYSLLCELHFGRIRTTLFLCACCPRANEVFGGVIMVIS